ncbi:MAG: hypothetical protein KIT13_04955 [Burkholderiales bacterium]|nr:hypothetical protein [Burkholderiales bacterium]MCW5575425.1 hypothetical protein [Burkholderiales bacterium]
MSGAFAKTGALLLAALLLAACGSPPPQKPRFNLAGYSPAFRQGHADGCTSAEGAQRRDERRFREDADYMMGWNDGHSACRRK